MFKFHSELTEAKMVDAAQALQKTLGSNNLIATIVVEDPEAPVDSVFVCCNLSPHREDQALYLARIANIIVEE